MHLCSKTITPLWVSHQSQTLRHSPRQSGATGSSEGKGIGLPWHKSPRLLLLEVGSGAMRLLASVSLGMPACSLEEIGEIGLAPPEESFTLSLPPSLPFSFSLSPSLLISKKNTIGFCTLEQSREASDGSRVWYSGGQKARESLSVPHNDTIQCNTQHNL